MSESSKSRESIEEFLARGGEITKLKTRKSKGYVSMSRGVAANSTPAASVRSKAAAAKMEKAVGK